jgi:hypothetical protein
MTEFYNYIVKLLPANSFIKIGLVFVWYKRGILQIIKMKAVIPRLPAANRSINFSLIVFMVHSLLKIKRIPYFQNQPADPIPASKVHRPRLLSTFSAARLRKYLSRLKSSGWLWSMKGNRIL